MAGDVFEEGVRTNALYILLMPLKRLQLNELLPDPPQNRRPIQRTRHQILRILAPREADYVADMAAHLTGVAPFDGFFDFAELDGAEF